MLNFLRRLAALKSLDRLLFITPYPYIYAAVRNLSQSLNNGRQAAQTPGQIQPRQLATETNQSSISKNRRHAPVSVQSLPANGKENNEITNPAGHSIVVIHTLGVGASAVRFRLARPNTKNAARRFLLVPPQFSPGF